MQLLDITLLLAILIFAMLSYNHQVLSKNTDISKKHANHNKHQIQHHNQNQIHHKTKTEKSRANKKHNKRPMQHHKQSKKSHENTNSPSHKQHLFQHNKKHLKSKQHYGHHDLKVSHNHKPHMNHFLRASETYCPPVQHERIIHGSVANGPIKFPYTAIYYICDRPQRNPVSHKGCQQWCGGSIISQFHILTAAHCLLDDSNKWRNPQHLVVRVGVQDLKDPEENSDRYRTTLAVQHLVIHKDYYDPKMTRDDIAIIKLKNEIKFSVLIQPVCVNGLHLNYQFKYQHPNVVVAGWGAIDEHGTLSDELKYTYQYISSFTSCEDNPTLKFIEFCVHHHHWKFGYPCGGDSGSGLLPLDKNFKAENVLIGVYHGRLLKYTHTPCDALKSFLNVSTYANWINENAQ